MPDHTTEIDGLGITTSPAGQGVLMRLAGRVTIDSAPAFRDRLLAQLRHESKSLTVDLSDVSYLDCAGIATLIEALKVARNHLITFRLEGLNGNLETLFRVTGLLALFETHGVNPSPASRVS